MADIRVDPSALASGSGQQGAVAQALVGFAGLVSAAADAAVEGAGHAGAGAAAAAWGAAWRAELERCGGEVGTASRNLSAAADAYRETDEGQMRT